MSSRSNFRYAVPFLAAVAQTIDEDGWATLTPGTYYYAIAGDDDDTFGGMHAEADSAIAFSSLEVQQSCHLNDVELHSAITTEWITSNPSSAYVPTVGAGTIATQAVVAKTAGAIGAALWDLLGIGSRRVRAKLVVTTTGAIRISTGGRK